MTPISLFTASVRSTFGPERNAQLKGAKSESGTIVSCVCNCGGLWSVRRGTMMHDKTNNIDGLQMNMD